ncbi:MAG: patatin-like phospholipase family protein [Elusimicrobia bacterium]|nr:patatin-like phospholipase family protein [Elusimicrobiota bacterium]
MRRMAAALLLVFAGASGLRSEEPVSDRLMREQLWREVSSMPADERPKVGLVLSAGSVRGLAHIGVIQALDDAGFPVDVVTGTSIGAIVGSLYAGGMPASKLWALNKDISLGTNFNKFRLLELILYDKLLSSKKLETWLKEQIGDLQFDKMPKRFACVAMDLKTGEQIIFREGPVAIAVRASMNLPGFFEPVEYRHRYLVDGAVVDYIPVDAARLLGAEWVLASVTEFDYARANPTNVMGTLLQIFDIRGSILAREQRKLANVVVEPAVGDIAIEHIHRGPEAMVKGVVAMTRKLPETEESLILHTLPRLMKHWRAP